MIEINAVARLPPRMAHGTWSETGAHHLSYRDWYLCRSGRLPHLRPDFHFSDGM